MSVKQNLRFFINHLGLSIKDFEASIEVSNGYVNSISKSIGIDKLQKIIEKYPTLSIEWLLTGVGPMLKDQDTQAHILKEPKTPYNKGIDYKEKYFDILEKYNKCLEDKEDMRTNFSHTPAIPTKPNTTKLDK